MRIGRIDIIQLVSKNLTEKYLSGNFIKGYLLDFVDIYYQQNADQLKNEIK